MPLNQCDLSPHLFALACRYATAAQAALGESLVSIALYGSVARGQAGPASDIDLFVVLREAPAGMLARRSLLEPVKEAMTQELELLWRQGIYTDFIEVIRTKEEATLFHPLYLDMSQEAVLLYDRDRFMETVLGEVRDRLKKGGAQRRKIGTSWYWDLGSAYLTGEAPSA